MSRNLEEYVCQFRADGDDHRALRIIEAVAGLKGENGDTRFVVEWLKKQTIVSDSDTVPESDRVLVKKVRKCRKRHSELEEWEAVLVEMSWLLAILPGLVGDEKNGRSDRFLKTVGKTAKRLGETLKENHKGRMDVPVLSLLGEKQQEEILLGQEVLEILRDGSLSRDERLNEIDLLLNPAPEKDEEELLNPTLEEQEKRIGEIQWSLVWEERYPLRMSGALERLRALVDERRKRGGRIGLRKPGRTELKKIIEKILKDTYGKKAPSIAEMISDLVKPPIPRRLRKS